MKNIENIV